MTMEGIFIPKEILEIKDLNITEKVVLAIYKYYTEQGKNKCCSLSKPQIADELGVSTRYMKKIKNHLKELGYIRTDGGIRVIYLGVQVGVISPTKGDTIVSTDDTKEDTIVSTGGHYSVQGGTPECPQGDTIVSTKGTPECPHKEEKKEKENKKEEKWVTNIKLLFARLPKDYHTPERLNYIKDNYKDRLNEADFNDGSVLESYVTGIKSELNKHFTINYVIPKTEPKSDFIDMF